MRWARSLQRYTTGLLRKAEAALVARVWIHRDGRGEHSGGLEDGTGQAAASSYCCRRGAPDMAPPCLQAALGSSAVGVGEGSHCLGVATSVEDFVTSATNTRGVSS